MCFDGRIVGKTSKTDTKKSSINSKTKPVVTFNQNQNAAVDIILDFSEVDINASQPGLVRFSNE